MPTTTNDNAPAALRIGAPAPDFQARSTQGPLRLSDHRGRWVVFFSHPADFTPVCTSEFIAFQKQTEAFSALDCDLIGLSVDSLYSHLAWVKDIEARFGTRISFPIVEDISMSIASAYGMVDETSDSTATVRSLFVIDPEGAIRALVHYPLAVGRSVAEILRLVTALQLTARENVSTPEGWTPGTEPVLPAPTSLSEADARPDTWYLSRAGGVT